MSNSNLTQTPQKVRFSVAITTEKYQNLINNTLNDPARVKSFIASITSAVAVNPALQECSASSIIAAALLGESLKLSPSPQLGQYYMVPFKKKEKRDRQGNIISPASTAATFVLGYKGYLQLAMRSGQLKKINVIEIKAGELKHFDPLNEEISCMIIEDYDEREAAPTIGYYAFFELLNGFRKAIYWSKKRMLDHADHYSPAFSKDAYQKIQNGEIAEDDMWKYSSFWYKNFDDMAKKTMLRQLISKGGCPMSADMMKGFENDSEGMSFDKQDNSFAEDVNEIDISDEILTSKEQKKIDIASEHDLSIEKIDLESI